MGGEKTWGPLQLLQGRGEHGDGVEQSYRLSVFRYGNGKVGAGAYAKDRWRQAQGTATVLRAGFAGF